MEHDLIIINSRNYIVLYRDRATLSADGKWLTFRNSDGSIAGVINTRGIKK